MRQPFEVLVFVHRPAATGEEFLVLHRVLGGFWHGLSGGLEGRESAEQAAVREIFEESGLDASTTLVPTGHAFVYSLADEPERIDSLPPGTTEIGVTTFLVEAPTAWEPTLNEEHDEYRWLPLADAAALYLYDDAREALLHAGSLLGVAA